MNQTSEKIMFSLSLNSIEFWKVLEEEKINRLIKKFILSNFDDVKEINFHSQMEAQSPTSPTPYLEKKAIEILFDKSQLTFIEMLHTKFEIQQALG